MSKKKQPERVTVTLDRNDLGQIIDGLQVRADLYRDTVKYWQGDDSVTETAEVSDEAEAEELASTYERLIDLLTDAKDGKVSDGN